MMTRQVYLQDVCLDAGTQIRTALDEQVIADYAHAMAQGTEFPPVVLFQDGSINRLADGFHRCAARARAGFSTIFAHIYDGTQREALWFALGANKANGQRLSQKDVRHAIELALTAWPDHSTKAIAEQIGCSQPYVASIKSALLHISTDLPPRVVGEDGRTYPASRVTRYKAETREQIAALVKAGESSMAICNQLHVRSALVADVRRELGVAKVEMTREAIDARRAQMKEMAESGHTSRQIAAAVSIGEEAVRKTLSRMGVPVLGDHVTRGLHHHDSNRIVTRMVMDAENLMEGEGLIDFADLDPTQIASWLKSLRRARESLSAFIRRLTEETSHGQAAKPATVEDPSGSHQPDARPDSTRGAA